MITSDWTVCQSSLFRIFNSLVRISPTSREAVLQYFSRVISLNSKRAGIQVRQNSCYATIICLELVFQVDPDTVASDSFMVNLQSILLHFAEPFMDASFTKVSIFRPCRFHFVRRLPDRSNRFLILCPLFAYRLEGWDPYQCCEWRSLGMGTGTERHVWSAPEEFSKHQW